MQKFIANRQKLLSLKKKKTSFVHKNCGKKKGNAMTLSIKNIESTYAKQQARKACY